MKILLVKSAHITDTEVSIIPPLGLLYLWSSLRQARPGRDVVRLVDLRVSPESEYETLLQTWQPDLIGISTMTAEADHAHSLSARASAMAPAATVVWGGPHPTAYVEESLADPNVDLLVLHEGEQTFPALVEALEAGHALDQVAGLAFRQASGIRRTDERPFVTNLDELPFPAWDQLDFSLYENVKSMGLVGPRRVAPVITSRACPYRCTYCHNMFGKKIQRRSPDNVLAELRLLRDIHGLRHIEIVDDIFNVDRQRMRQILERIIDQELGLQLAFPNGLRGDLLRDDEIELFKRAGTVFVSVAIESASPRIQKQIRKNIRLPQVQAAIRGFVRRGIFVNCYYMLGFPGETRAEMQCTLDFARRQPSHTAMFFVVNPFKGTELGESLPKDVGPLTENFGKHTYHDIAANRLLLVPHDELRRMIRKAYIRFFANPPRLYRIARDHPQRKWLLSGMFLLLRRILRDIWNQPSTLLPRRQVEHLPARLPHAPNTAPLPGSHAA